MKNWPSGPKLVSKDEEITGANKSIVNWEYFFQPTVTCFYPPPLNDLTKLVVISLFKWIHTPLKSFGYLQPDDITLKQWILLTLSRLIWYILIKKSCCLDSFGMAFLKIRQKLRSLWLKIISRTRNYLEHGCFEKNFLRVW